MPTVVDGYWTLEGEGDVLRGVLEEVEFADYVRKDGSETRVPVLHIRAGEESAPYWAWHKVLQRKLRSLRPQLGEVVEITRGRERHKRDGTRYYEYGVRCPERSEPVGVDWNELARPLAGDDVLEDPGPERSEQRELEPASIIPDDVREAHRRAKQQDDDPPF
jgi:hypothetical protein